MPDSAPAFAFLGFQPEGIEHEAASMYVVVAGFGQQYDNRALALTEKRTTYSQSELPHLKPLHYASACYTLLGWQLMCSYSVRMYAIEILEYILVPCC